MKAKNHALYDPRDDKPPLCRERGLILGPHAKTPQTMISGKASNWAWSGRHSGIKRPVFGIGAMTRAARNPCFLGGLRDAAPINARRARQYK
jgi:hypothetical protein